MDQLPFLTDDEIAQICAPLKVPGYQVKYLQRLGLIVNRKPNGKPLVARGEFERVLVGGPKSPPERLPTQPNYAAFEALMASRKKRKPKAEG